MTRASTRCGRRRLRRGWVGVDIGVEGDAFSGVDRKGKNYGDIGEEQVARDDE